MWSGPVSLAHPSACSWQDCAWTEASQGSEGKVLATLPGGLALCLPPNGSLCPEACALGTSGWGHGKAGRAVLPQRLLRVSMDGALSLRVLSTSLPHEIPGPPSGLTKAKCPQASNIMVNSVHTPNSPLNQERKWLSGPE